MCLWATNKLSNIILSTSGSSPVTELGLEQFVRSGTDWVRVDALTDEDIDTSELPPLTEADFARSEWRLPASANANGDTGA